MTTTITMTTTTTTIISEGADRIRPAWRHSTEGQSHGQACNTRSSFPPRVHPIPSSHPISSGHFRRMAPSPADKRPDCRLGCKLWRASLGDVGCPNRTRPDRAAKRRSKRFGGTERSRAPTVTHNVVRRTCVPRSIRITVNFGNLVKQPKWVWKWSAPNVTHSVDRGT